MDRAPKRRKVDGGHGMAVTGPLTKRAKFRRALAENIPWTTWRSKDIQDRRYESVDDNVAFLLMVSTSKYIRRELSLTKFIVRMKLATLRKLYAEYSGDTKAHYSKRILAKFLGKYFCGESFSVPMRNEEDAALNAGELEYVRFVSLCARDVPRGILEVILSYVRNRHILHGFGFASWEANPLYILWRRNLQHIARNHEECAPHYCAWGDEVS